MRRVSSVAQFSDKNPRSDVVAALRPQPLNALSETWKGESIALEIECTQRSCRAFSPHQYATPKLDRSK